MNNIFCHFSFCPGMNNTDGKFNKYQIRINQPNCTMERFVLLTRKSENQEK